MRIEIEIPKEFEGHFKYDRFEDSLTRLIADAHMVAGTYEKETAIMLIKALKSSKPAYDVDAAVRKLEDEEKQSYTDFEQYADNTGLTDDDDWHYMGLKRAIEIVRYGLAEANE